MFFGCKYDYIIKYNVVLCEFVIGVGMEILYIYCD